MRSRCCGASSIGCIEIGCSPTAPRPTSASGCAKWTAEWRVRRRRPIAGAARRSKRCWLSPASTRRVSTLLWPRCTGLRRGEVLGLQWIDVDFEQGRIHVRRAHVRRQVMTPESGRGRQAVTAPPLAELMLDVLAARRREALAFGWPETPAVGALDGPIGPLHSRAIRRAERLLAQVIEAQSESMG